MTSRECDYPVVVSNLFYEVIEKASVNAGLCAVVVYDNYKHIRRMINFAIENQLDVSSIDYTSGMDDVISCIHLANGSTINLFRKDVQADYLQGLLVNVIYFDEEFTED